MREQKPLGWFCNDCNKSFPEWTDEQADIHYDQTKHDMEFVRKSYYTGMK